MSRAWRFAVEHYLLMPAGGALALLWANTYGDSYFRLAQALALPVNEIGMALVLGYLAQEVIEAALPGGWLHPFRRLVVPIIGGIGATIGATIVYTGYLATGDEGQLVAGWPIGAAADVVIALAVARAIFGRGPAVTMAIVVALTSDVIALAAVSRYHPVADQHPAAALLIGAAIIVSIVLRRRGVESSWPYVAVAGALSWCGCYWSGIQPALSLLPVVPFLRHSPRNLVAGDATFGAHHPAAHFESVFEVPVQAIAFLFAFTNAGIALRGFGTGTWAVMLGSLIGRPAGALVALWAAAGAGLQWPRGMTWKEAAVAALSAAPASVFGLLVAVSLFPIGSLRVETKLGAILTVLGLVLPFLAAWALGAGRFAVEGGAPALHVAHRRRSL